MFIFYLLVIWKENVGTGRDGGLLSNIKSFLVVDETWTITIKCWGVDASIWQHWLADSILNHTICCRAVSEW